ncbi:hypothetical protein IMSHALPRED_008511 [Imshaugia aleurites]|uniref:Uncharacterized protein n=1 Tax=Imshaugia aleurites TaxID=172621 RepID=A0A8H3IDT4_9LECA|nr:hypothetical protein IMSHALPRED_008511 [Imshaugia aleurites]
MQRLSWRPGQQAQQPSLATQQDDAMKNGLHAEALETEWQQQRQGRHKAAAAALAGHRPDITTSGARAKRAAPISIRTSNTSEKTVLTMDLM